MVKLRSCTLSKLVIAVLMSIVVVGSQSGVAIARDTAVTTPLNCTQVIAKAVARGVPNPPQLTRYVDALQPRSEVVVDFGQGCRVGITLAFFVSGGQAKLAELLGHSGSGDPAYPQPPSPATEKGTDPYCYMHSWQTDCCGIQTWATDVYQFWDNWAPCCPALVNPYAVQQWVTDPFFVNTRNDYTDSWLQYPYHVQADGWADFYSSIGPTGDGVHHWVDAYSDSCGGAASFWGATVPGGSYHNVGPNGPYN